MFNTVHGTEKVRTESFILCQFSKIVGSPLVPKRPAVLGSRSINSSRHTFSSVYQGVHLSREHLLTLITLAQRSFPLWACVSHLDRPVIIVAHRVSSW